MNCASKNFTMLFCSLQIFIHILIKRNPVRCLAVISKTVFNCLLCRNTFCMCSTSFGHREIYILSFSLIQPNLNQQYQIKKLLQDKNAAFTSFGLFFKYFIISFSWVYFNFALKPTKCWTDVNFQQKHMK